MKKIPAFSILSILLSATLIVGCDHKEDATVGSCTGDGIVGGKSVGSEDSLATKVVMVRARINDHEANLCTGTLVSRNIVITAAHCLTGAKSARVVFDVSPGCNANFNPNTQSIEVRKAAVHPKYDETVKGMNDLALLRLASPAPSNYEVIGLYDGTSQLSSQSVTYAGYGRTRENDEFNQSLRSVVKKYSGNIFYSKERNLVTSQSNGQGICQGDSGGPVFFEVNYRLQLAGVNSVVAGKSDSKICRGISEAMYIPAHLEWITKKMKDLSALR
jgi:secreted trypsin-like serine protease